MYKPFSNYKFNNFIGSCSGYMSTYTHTPLILNISVKSRSIESDDVIFLIEKVIDKAYRKASP